MNWIQKLYETYNNCQAKIGYSDDENERPLLPICHITQQAHIEIVIDGKGNFKRARIVPKDDARTIIPCTEDSASRTSGITPHPLCDKMQYILMDYSERTGNNRPYFSSYIMQLEEWCNSSFSNPKAVAVMKYVKKNTIVNDLAKRKILFIGDDGKFLSKSKVERNRNSNDIFSVINDQEKAFIRWAVEIPSKPETEVWKDKALWESWKNYYLNSKEKEPFCFITGKNDILTSKHPKFIRREGDRAKLISSNDTSGFTYRGRFENDEQACNVSLDVSQKAHYALSWLISRQGYKSGDQVVVAWATSGAEIPQPTDDPTSILGTDDLVIDEAQQADTAQDLAIKLKKKIAGYSQKIEAADNVVVMGLDSATKGRLAITYYRALRVSDFLQRLNDWHKTCAWIHRYRSIEVTDKKSGKTKRIFPKFVGAPAPSDIAEAAYATNNDGKLQINEKLRKSTVERILPCIIDGQPIPRDIVKSAVRKASNRVALENWQWNKILSIACALYKKHKEKEDYGMALDETRSTRDYLYGRLLAIADQLEEHALYKAEKGRATNATRYMQQFSQHPYRTWGQIHSALIPYMVRLNGAFFYKNLIAEVKSLFDPDDFTNDKPLSGEYLLGYYSQRQKFFEKEDDSTSSDES